MLDRSAVEVKAQRSGPWLIRGLDYEGVQGIGTEFRALSSRFRVWDLGNYGFGVEGVQLGFQGSFGLVSSCKGSKVYSL